MRILVTGGAGYIGSHTLLELLSKEYLPIVVDNFSNSHPNALKRVENISGKAFPFFDETLLHSGSISKIFKEFLPEAVVHFAGAKAVGESEKNPLFYYENNVFGTLNLLKAMDSIGCKKIIFSSSATVYGTPRYLPYDEKHDLAPVNPYGRTKYFIEELIRDWASTDGEKSAVFLRYFNPAGAHKSGEIGEDPLGIPGNLIPFISQVAIGKYEELKIFGADFETPDGTGVRDYIHVSDLADGHIEALRYLRKNTGIEIINLGSGKGYSVMEVLSVYRQICGREIPYSIVPRRKGDLASYFAQTEKAKKLLNWSASRSLEDMCRDSWNWQIKNPTGYE